MNILKYILFVVLGLGILFVLIGFLKPKVSYGHTITTDKSVQEAWAVTQDISKYDQWLDGFKSIELLSGAYGTVDSKYKVIVTPGEGQPDFEMIETVESIKEFDHVDLHFDSEMMDFDQILRFSEANGQTTITTESTVSGKGMMMRSMFALMEMFTNSFQAQEEKNINNLKKVIDENKTDYYPAPVEQPEIDS